MLAKAKLDSSITFIVLASFTIVTYDHQNMFIIQATVSRGLYYKTITIVIMMIISDATVWSVTYDRH